MQFTYAPEGADPRSWEFEPKKLMNPEAEAIERHTGMPFAKWADAVTEGSVLALHGLLFVMLKRSNPTLKWDEVQFCLDEVDFRLSDEESREAREALLKKAADGDLDDDERHLLTMLEAGADDAPAPDEGAEDGPKD